MTSWMVIFLKANPGLTKMLKISYIMFQYEVFVTVDCQRQFSFEGGNVQNLDFYT
jgi:hypothetical protein